MEQEVKSAEAAGHIQFAINLLSPRLLQFIQVKDKDRNKSDFSTSIRIILQKVQNFFPDSDDGSGIKKIFKRAYEIRNEYSHQDFDVNRFEHDVECLAKIASCIGAADAEKKILALIATSEIGPNIWGKLKDEGNQHYKDGKWTEAMNCYTKAIRLNPKVAALYSNRALCEIQLSKFQLAREDAEDALELDPKQVKPYRILSEALYNLSLFDEALSITDLGLKIDQRDEVLLLRKRDYDAMKITKEINRNPVAGGLQSFKEPGSIKNFLGTKNRTDVLPDDVYEVKMSHMKVTKEIAEAHKLFLSAKGSILKEGKALRIFESAAMKGNAEGLYNVSLMYKHGRAGLPRDFLKALEYCRKAAAQKPFIKFKDLIFPNLGVAEAENSLGIAYRDGVGVDQNDILSFQWFLKSAQHNCSSAQNNLGLALLNGSGCSQNMTSARAWFEKAAELGQSEARYNLADMLIKGEGGPVDTSKAAKLLKEAADQGLPGALAYLQLLLRSGGDGERSMTDSRKLVEKRAMKEDVEAIFLLGLNYLEGTGGFEQDFDLAEKQLRKASELDHPNADLLLGKLLLETNKNEDAFTFIKRAAEVKGDMDAQWLLGECFANGDGCKRDEQQSRRWLLRAKRGGYQPHGLDKEKDDVNDIIKGGAKLEKFETDQNLTTSGMSLIDRLERMMLSLTETPEILRDIFKFRKQAKPTPNVCSMKKQILDWLPEMNKRAKNGSKTAQRFFQAEEMMVEAEQLLKRNEISKAFSLWRVATSKVWDVIRIATHVMDSFHAAAVVALNKNANDAEALFIICHCNFLKKFDQNDQLSMVQRCTELDPTIAEYHSLLGSIHGFREDFANAVRCFDRALQLDPHPDWFYCRASSIRLHLGDKNPTEIIQAYHQFLALAEPDARKVPEAYYSIALTYSMMGEMEKAEQFYNKGLMSEQPNVRLPCFEPVEDDFPPKFMMAKNLLMKKKFGIDKLMKNLPASRVVKCGNCDREDGVSMRCSKCKIVSYCNVQCQKNHWKTHKKICQ